MCIMGVVDRQLEIEMNTMSKKVHEINVRLFSKTYCGLRRNIKDADVTLIREETTCRSCNRARRAWR